MLLDVLREAHSVVWPVACAGCGALDVVVCRACRAALERPVTGSVDGVPLVAAAVYDGAVRRLVLASKESGQRSLMRVLGAALERASGSLPHGVPVLVPSSRAGWLRRGFSPVRLLARHAGMRGVELVARDAGEQKARSARSRAASRAASLAVRARDRRALEGMPCLVVDDVVTTGSTARAALEALRAVGARPVGIVAVARAERRFGARDTPSNSAGEPY